MKLPLKNQPPQKRQYQRAHERLRTAAWALGTTALLTFTALATASDYEREARFAELVKSQLVVGDAVTLSPPPGSSAKFRPFLGLYANGKPDLPALVLAHGVGNHPDEGLTGSLRQRLFDMGYTTLAIQLPIAAKDATVDNYYPALFPEASSRLQVANGWLRAQGHPKVVLISHTMGSWMANVYLDQAAANSAYLAWVCISLTGGYSSNVRNYTLPVQTSPSRCRPPGAGLGCCA